MQIMNIYFQKETVKLMNKLKEMLTFIVRYQIHILLLIIYIK